MKKASKILTLILVFVLLAGVFSGCAMFTRNTGRYRALVAVTVGNEEITVGKILDNFNNYYNTYSAYIGQGLTLEWLLQMTMSSVVTQAMKVDSYVSNAQPETHAYKDFCHNSQYLTEKEIEYCIKYVKYITFQSLDNSVQSLLSVDRTINDEEEEDTSRDFTKPDELKADTYSEHVYLNRIFNDDADEYFEKYYDGINIGLKADVAEYVYASEQAASARLNNLKDRLEEGDAEITYAEYKNAQEKIVNQYQRTIANSYNIDFESFILNQIEDMVASVIAAKYDYNINKTIDTTNLSNTLEVLNNNLKTNSDAQAAGFELNDSFVSFIEGLSSTSYIYSVPEGYNYIFVKNILIPFNAQQKAMLSNHANELGGKTDAPSYVKLQNDLAKEIMAENFTEKDADGKNVKIGGLFDTITDSDGNEKLVIKADENNPLYKVFKENGIVDATGYESKDDAVIDYMKSFNTDTAQHTAAYDYVVRVGDVPSDYTAKWVPEFVAAANEAWNDGAGKGNYALAISTYGVHIVYYSADVEAQNINFTAESILDTTKPEYKLFNTYFSEQSSRMLHDELDKLQESYLEQNKITTNKNFDRFLKDNNFKFDLIEYLSDHED